MLKERGNKLMTDAQRSNKKFRAYCPKIDKVIEADSKEEREKKVQEEIDKQEGNK